jgi:hypothetical protein
LADWLAGRRLQVGMMAQRANSTFDVRQIQRSLSAAGANREGAAFMAKAIAYKRLVDAGKIKDPDRDSLRVASAAERILRKKVNPEKVPKGYERISGHVVKIGSKRHKILLDQKRLQGQNDSRSNPWPFSRPDARRTTPAHGGIAFHQGGRKTARKDWIAASTSAKTPDDLNAEYLRSLSKSRALKSTTFKGRSIKPTEGGAWVVPSIDKESEFDTLQDAKAFITSWKRNPAKGAAQVFEEFHGFEPSEVVTVTKHIHHHEHLAAAGKLTHLDVWGIDGTGHHISGFKGAFLAFNESKNQLFVEGGDQSLDLADFGIDSPHELETVGRLTDIGYQTNKTHLGDEGGEAVYVHKFRSTNQNGKHVVVKIARYPDLIYDVRNEQLLFSGGSYEILREGINK